MLVESGMQDAEIYAAALGDTLLDLASEGRLREALGRPRRRWAGFADQAHLRKVKWGREYAAFCAAHDIHRVVQVVVRSPKSLVPIEHFRAAHAQQSALLNGRLRYGRKRFAAGFASDIIAAEIIPAAPDGDAVDLHFHLASRATTDELVAMRDYFRRSGWSWWDAVTARSPDRYREPGVLANYVAKGLACALHRGSDAGHGFTPQTTATLYRQTRGLAMTRSTGAFRAWKAELQRDGLVVAEDNRRVWLASRALRARRRRSSAVKSVRSGSGARMSNILLFDTVNHIAPRVGKPNESGSAQFGISSSPDRPTRRA